MLEFTVCIVFNFVNLLLKYVAFSDSSFRGHFGSLFRTSYHFAKSYRLRYLYSFGQCQRNLKEYKRPKLRYCRSQARLRIKERVIISTHFLKYQGTTFENNLRPCQVVKSANLIALQKEVKYFTKHLRCKNLRQVHFRTSYFAKNEKF